MTEFHSVFIAHSSYAANGGNTFLNQTIRCQTSENSNLHVTTDRILKLILILETKINMKDI